MTTEHRRETPAQHAPVAAGAVDLTQPAPITPEPELSDAPGIDFDSALLLAAGGLARRPLVLRESLSLAGRLVRQPAHLLGPLAELANEAARIARGRSELKPGQRDRRYSDPAWTGNPVFRVLAQGHAAITNTVDDVLVRADLEPADDYRLRLVADNVGAALSPANWAWTNPAAWKATIDSGGCNLVTGLRRFSHDIRQPSRLPARSEPGDHVVGEDVAATPGAVVLRTPVMELIQYEPVTNRVRGNPLLIVPSLVNKYYLADMSPGNSLIEHLVQQGVQVFAISWANPDRQHRALDLDSYVSAIVEALDAVREITGEEQAHALGICAGGQLLMTALAYLAQLGRQDELATCSLIVCVIDHRDPASPSGLLTRPAAEAALRRIDRKGLLDGRDLQVAMAWLRPVDSIWWAWVQRYLLDVAIPRLPLFHWAEDTTNISSGLVRDLIGLVLANKLAFPGSLRVLGQPVDLSRVRVPAYLMAGHTDHLTPWRSAYATINLIGSDAEFVLVRGGHLQAILQHPQRRTVEFLTASSTPADPDRWIESAVSHHGSWWAHWIHWFSSRSSADRPAPTTFGGDAFPVLELAPGTYVRDRLDQRTETHA